MPPGPKCTKCGADLLSNCGCFTPLRTLLHDFILRQYTIAGDGTISKRDAKTLLNRIFRDGEKLR